MNCVTCVGVLAYPNSPYYITDQTSIIRFQVSVVDTLNGIEPGAPSHVIRDLSEYATREFIASFDVPLADGQSARKLSLLFKDWRR